MAQFLDIVDDRGKVNYNNLIDLIKMCSETAFVSQVRHPMLVGKELYDGELKQNVPQGGSNLRETNTMLFKPSDLHQLRNEISDSAEDPSQFIKKTRPLGTRTQLGNTQEQQTPGIARAIYTLRKGPNAIDRTQNVITIGRSFSNDITIADYVVSKHHSQITIFYGKYFLTDLSSTNGTKLNQQIIEPDTKVNIPDNAEIAFGRVAFVFVKPEDVYRRLKAKIR